MFERCVTFLCVCQYIFEPGVCLRCIPKWSPCTWSSSCFKWIFSKALEIEHRGQLKMGFSRVKSFRMSTRWAPYDNFEVLTWWWGHWPYFGGGDGKQISKLSRLVQRVSGMAGDLIFACQSAPPTTAFWDTTAARLRVISPGDTVTMHVPSGESKFF